MYLLTKYVSNVFLKKEKEKKKMIMYDIIFHVLT